MQTERGKEAKYKFWSIPKSIIRSTPNVIHVFSNNNNSRPKSSKQNPNEIENAKKNNNQNDNNNNNDENNSNVENNSENIIIEENNNVNIEISTTQENNVSISSEVFKKRGSAKLDVDARNRNKPKPPLPPRPKKNSSESVPLQKSYSMNMSSKITPSQNSLKSTTSPGHYSQNDFSSLRMPTSTQTPTSTPTPTSPRKGHSSSILTRVRSSSFNMASLKPKKKRKNDKKNAVNNNNYLNDNETVNIVVRSTEGLKGILVNKNNPNNDDEEEIEFKFSQKNVSFFPDVNIIGGATVPLETHIATEKVMMDNMEIHHGDFTSGYLFKYISTPFIESMWIKRWVVFNGRVIQYYSSEFSTDLIGKLDLSMANSVTIGREFHIDGGRRRKFAIMVKFDDLDGYYSEHLFSHPNSDTLQEWFSLFNPEQPLTTTPRRRMTIGEIARAPHENPIYQNLLRGSVKVQSNSITPRSRERSNTVSEILSPSDVNLNYYHEENRKNSINQKHQTLIKNGEYHGNFEDFKEFTKNSPMEIGWSSKAANVARQRRRWHSHSNLTSLGGSSES